MTTIQLNPYSRVLRITREQFNDLFIKSNKENEVFTKQRYLDNNLDRYKIFYDSYREIILPTDLSKYQHIKYDEGYGRYYNKKTKSYLYTLVLLK